MKCREKGFGDFCRVFVLESRLHICSIWHQVHVHLMQCSVHCAPGRQNIIAPHTQIKPYIAQERHIMITDYIVMIGIMQLLQIVWWCCRERNVINRKLLGFEPKAFWILVRYSHHKSLGSQLMSSTQGAHSIILCRLEWAVTSLLQAVVPTILGVSYSSLCHGCLLPSSLGGDTADTGNTLCWGHSQV